MRVPISLCLVLLLASCGGEARDPEPAAAPLPPATLVQTPPDLLEKCRRHPELRQACPAMVPAVTDVRYERSRSSVESGRVWVFFAEWNAPRPGLDPANAPPQFAHVNVFAGALEVFGGVDVGGRLHGEPPRKRRSGLTLGPREWDGRAGELLLAASYPHGGIQGDHLVFQWTEGDRDYSLSLHAWEPLDETEATLKAVVESLP